MNTIKSLAQKAKNRMRSVGLNANYAVSTMREEDVIKKCAVSYLSVSYQASLEDDKLYPKVKKMVDENPDNPFPLKSLIDKKEFESLPESEKDKYILRLSQRYHKLRQKYEQEIKNL